MGDQSKDIIRDTRPVRELRDDERAAEMGKEHVSFAKFVPAGDYFDKCEHYPSFRQSSAVAEIVDSAVPCSQEALPMADWGLAGRGKEPDAPCIGRSERGKLPAMTDEGPGSR